MNGINFSPSRRARNGRPYALRRFEMGPHLGLEAQFWSQLSLGDTGDGTVGVSPVTTPTGMPGFFGRKASARATRSPPTSGSS